MKDNVVEFTGETTLDLPVSKVLDKVLEDVDTLDSVTVLGWDKDGCLYLASSQSKYSDIAWILDKAKSYLIEG